MKNNLFFYLFFSIMLVSCGQPKLVIINNPEFESTNTDLLSISKIELTDTATILYVDVYNNPGNWIGIASATVLKGENNRTYKLLGSEGFELDKGIPMPESGTQSFLLFFDPVDKAEKEIDYIEGDAEGDFRVTGIKLYGIEHPAKAIQCTLKGIVVDRPQSSRLALLKYGEDFRVANKVYIPIRDGKFEYVLNCDYEEVYQLVFLEEMMRGHWRAAIFIAEPGVVNFTLNAEKDGEEDSNRYIIEGNNLTKEYWRVNNEEDNLLEPEYDSLNIISEELDKEDKYFNDDFKKLREKAEALDENSPESDKLWQKVYKMNSTRENLTPEAKHLEDEYKKVHMKGVDFEYQYAKKHIDIVGYTLLMEVIDKSGYLKMDLSPYSELFNTVYKPKYPKHPYTRKIEELIMASTVKVGNPYIDVTMEDIEGNEVKLSKQVDGKVTLLYLWASFCGPCIKYGKNMVPVYEAYKDKGFAVVGISRENSKEDMIVAMNRFKFPWNNFLELKDKNKIWSKYGLGNAGGGEFLIGADGKILAVQPTVEEVEEILKKLLK